MTKLFVTMIFGFCLAMCPISAFAVYREGYVSHVSKFNETGRCDCEDKGKDCDNINYCAGEYTHLRDKLNTWGYDVVKSQTNMGVEFWEWADINRDGDGRDHYSTGVDGHDIAFICTHGGIVCQSGNYRSSILLGDGSEECNLDYGLWSGNDVDWGDTDLNYVIIDACQSAQKCVFDNGGYSSSNMRSEDMGMLLGFHGSSFDNSTHRTHFQTFVNNTYSNNLGDEWVDQMTDFNSGDDECGTAVVWADTSAHADTIYNSGGFFDYISYGSGIRKYYYIDNCDPYNGNKL